MPTTPRLFIALRAIDHLEATMNQFFRKFTAIIAAALVLGVGTLPGCASMGGGGGGMHYLVDPLGFSAQDTLT